MGERAKDLVSLASPHLVAQRLDPRWRTVAHNRLIGHTIAKALRTPDSKTAIITPPQVGKSTLANNWAPFWLLARDPSKKIITTSYGERLATRNGRTVRNLVRDHGARFGMALDPGTASAAEWYTTAGGGVKSAGVGSGITGFACDGALIIDDVFKSRAEAESSVYQENVWEWLSSSALTRLAPGTPTMMIGTLWTERDPILRLIEEEGRVEDGGQWTVIHLPALADLTLTGGRDALGRTDGAPLTHPKIPDSDPEKLARFWAKKRKGVLLRDWASLYQGDPSPREGALVSWDILHASTVPRSKIPAPVRVVVTVDPSGGGGDEVGIIGAQLGRDENVYITHDWSATMPVTKWPMVVCDLAEELKADRIVLEINYGHHLVVQPIRSAWTSKERTCMMPAISTVTALRGKVLRAEPMAQEMAMGRFKMAAGLDKLAKQWASWQPGSTYSPGRLDASVYAGVALLRPALENLMRQDDNPEAPRGRRRRDGAGGRRLPGR